MATPHPPAEGLAGLQEQLYAEGRTCGNRSVLLPRPGKLGVFDRSHDEDVLAARVRGMVERRTWSRRYMEAYADALERCGTEHAPWFIVPADRKWYRNWAITRLLIEHLEDLGLRWPEADFDVEEERRRVREIP
jgi:polyphosphate kinase 2 (PPK2 family)